MTLPRANLPPLNFSEKSVVEVQSTVINAYEAIAGRSLAPGDPIRVFLEALSTLIAQQRSIIDFSAKQNLLSYVQGPFIDHIGAFVGVQRLEAQPALTTIRFALSQAQSSVYLIPAGTQLVAGRLNFATTANLEIPIGSLFGEVAAQCTIAGTIGNNLLPGQIRVLLNPLPFVQSAQNITPSSGGAEKEDDESYVSRIQIAPSSFSSAGPKAAYNYWTKTANPAISDVSLPDPSSSPGTVDILPLLQNGVIPGQEVLDQIFTVLNNIEVRPFTDRVVVSAPAASNYDLNVQYWIKSENAAQVSSIQVAVNAAVNDFVLWQKSRIGRDINPDQLRARMINAGAKRVNVISPSFTVLTEWQVAQQTSVNVSYMGLENV